ncbi:MAG: protein kinase [Planctomycetes bacterium]|nr:protein kinase [Planctomycetota bacterium]
MNGDSRRPEARLPGAIHGGEGPLSEPERERRILDLVQGALDLEAPERETWLRSTGADDELLREVLAVLAQDDSAPRPGAAGGFVLGNVAEGASLGNYTLVRLVGHGGMGEVWEARDTRLPRRVAIKFIHQRLLLRPLVRQLFRREARLVSTLNHPNITTIHELGQQGERDYIVFEFLEGETLNKRVARGASPPADVIALMLPLARALAFAHERGVIHRDLKPANVMVTSHGAPKILDFGLAKLAEQDSSAGSTIETADLEMGTPGYMSPEQVHRRPVDRRTDVFSFGCVLFELLTGRPAFRGKSLSQTIGAILTHEPPAVDGLVRDVPRPLAHVVTRCLRKDKDERWASMDEVAAELESIADTGRGLRRPVRRRDLLVGAATIAIAAMLGWWFAHGAASGSSDTPVLSVVVLGDSPADKRRQVLDQAFGTAFGNLDGLRLVSRSALADRAWELGDDPDALTSSAALRAAREAGSSHLLQLGLADDAGSTMLTLELQTVSGGVVIWNRRPLPSDDEDLALVADVAREVLVALRVDPSEAPDEERLRDLLGITKNARIQFADGQRLLHASDWAGAVEPLVRAIREDPGHARASLALSIALRFAGREPDALSAAEDAVEREDRLQASERPLARANLAYLNGHYQAALAQLADLGVVFDGPSDGRDPFAEYILAEIETHSCSDPAPALGAERLERLLAREPGFKHAYDHMVLDRAVRGDIALARSHLAQWEATESVDRAKVLGAMVTALDGDVADAWRDAKTLAAGGLDLYFVTEIALLADDWDAVESMRVPESPTYGAWARRLRAAYRTLRGRFDPALDDLGVLARQGFVDDDGFRGGMGVAACALEAELRLLLDDPRGARDAAESSLVLQPEGLRARYLAGRFAALTGDLAAARVHEDALRGLVARTRDPSCAMFSDGLAAELLLQQGDASGARDLLTATTSHWRPDFDWYGSTSSFAALLLDTLARACDAAGDAPAAESARQRLVDSGFGRSTHPVPYVRALFELGRAHLARGDAARGRELLERVLALWGDADRPLALVDETRRLLGS